MATREHNQPSSAALRTVFYSYGNRCESLCLLQLPVHKDQRTGFGFSFLLDFLLISPHCLFINQLGIVSRFFPPPLSIHAPPFSSLLSPPQRPPAYLSLGFRLPVPGSGIIAVEINPSDAISPFLSLKTSASPSTTRSSRSGISVAFDHARHPLPSLGPI